MQLLFSDEALQLSTKHPVIFFNDQVFIFSKDFMAREKIKPIDFALKIDKEGFSNIGKTLIIPIGTKIIKKERKFLLEKEDYPDFIIDKKIKQASMLTRLILFEKKLYITIQDFAKKSGIAMSTINSRISYTRSIPRKIMIKAGNNRLIPYDFVLPYSKAGRKKKGTAK